MCAASLSGREPRNSFAKQIRRPHIDTMRALLKGSFAEMDGLRRAERSGDQPLSTAHRCAERWVRPLLLS